MGWLLLVIFVIGLFWGWIVWAAGWGIVLLVLRKVLESR